MNELTGVGSHIDRNSATRRFSPTLATALATLALIGGSPKAMADATGLNAGRIPGAEQQRSIAPVLPAQAKPFGYSLDEMARLVAPFNVTDHSGPPPNSPFQILYTTNDPVPTFEVAQGKFLYVPLAYNDDSAPVIGRFPANVQNRQQNLRYWYSQSELGVTVQKVIIDGKTVPLGAAFRSIWLAVPVNSFMVRSSSWVGG